MKTTTLFFALLLTIGFSFASYAQTNIETNKNNSVNIKNPTNPTNSTEVTKVDEGTETNQNESAESSSLFDTVKQGGFMMYPLMLLALLASTIIIERIIFLIRKRPFSNHKLQALLDISKSKSSSKFKEELEDDLQSETNRFIDNAESGLGLLSGIGNLAPIVGFFGTVIGMIEAFAAIAAATTVNAKIVAVGIQTALVTTAGGLAVAVPTLGFFYLYQHFSQKTFEKSQLKIAELTNDLPRISEG